MKARIMLVLVAGWMMLAAAPVLAQAQAVSAQARAAVADAGSARVMVVLRPRAAFSRAGLSPVRAVRMA